jgi:hypothetical protein
VGRHGGDEADLSRQARDLTEGQDGLAAREGPESRRDRLDALGHRKESRHVGLADEEGHGRAAEILANSHEARATRERRSKYSLCGSNKH